MFTGLIEQVGTLRQMKHEAQGAELTIAGQIDELALGDSIAVNGVCLTVTAFTANSFCADVMQETLRRSTLGTLTIGSRVNLERAMPANGRFGGHIVSGHIDGVGHVTKIQPEGNAVWYTIATPPDILRYLVLKGSIAIDGTSLTIARVTKTGFAVSIIPHTAAHTILAHYQVGTSVNLEVDVIAKYVERLCMPSVSDQAFAQGGLTMQALLEAGF